MSLNNLINPSSLPTISCVPDLSIATELAECGPASYYVLPLTILTSHNFIIPSASQEAIVSPFNEKVA